MTSANYQPFVDRMIRRYEGGYCWDKADPGGPTKYGVTCYDLAEHRFQKMTSMAQWAPLVQAMELAEAAAIYRSKYAAAIRFDDLPAGIDCVMMDYAVNSGIGRANLVARRIVGFPAGATMTADLLIAIKAKGAKWFIETMNAERLAFMHQIRGGAAWAQFGKGWGARVADLTVYAEHVAAGAPQASAPPAPDLSAVPTPKATHVDDPAATAKGGSAIGGAIVAGGAAHQAGAPLWAIVLCIAVPAIAGIAYLAWKQNQAARLNAQVHLPQAA